MEKSRVSIKRKRDDKPLDIIKDLEELDQGELSDDSRDTVDELLAKAKAAFENPEMDQDSLQASWTIFKRANSKVKKTKEEITRLQDMIKEKDKENDKMSKELADARKGMDDATKKLDRLNFLFLVGDWCNAINKAVQHYEGPGVKSNLPGSNIITIDANACREYHIRVEGRTQAVADKLADSSKDWTVARKKQCSTTVANVDSEVQKVEDWRGKGSVEANAPNTPYLDRLERLCQDAGLSRVDYLEIAKTYGARNEAAHNACVELTDHFDPETNKVDWHAVKGACEKVKDGLQNDLNDGRITKENHAFFVFTIDTWLRMMVSAWPTDSPLPITPFGISKQADARLKYQGSRKKAEVHDPHHGTSYKRGKWDDL